MYKGELEGSMDHSHAAAMSAGTIDFHPRSLAFKRFKMRLCRVKGFSDMAQCDQGPRVSLYCGFYAFLMLKDLADEASEVWGSLSRRNQTNTGSPLGKSQGTESRTFILPLTTNLITSHVMRVG